MSNQFGEDKNISKNKIIEMEPGFNLGYFVGKLMVATLGICSCALITALTIKVIIWMF